MTNHAVLAGSVLAGVALWAAVYTALLPKHAPALPIAREVSAVRSAPLPTLNRRLLVQGAGPTYPAKSPSRPSSRQPTSRLILRQTCRTRVSLGIITGHCAGSIRSAGQPFRMSSSSTASSASEPMRHAEAARGCVSGASRSRSSSAWPRALRPERHPKHSPAAALLVTCAETKRLLALPRTISHSQPCSPRFPCTAA
jgi:hypothetical protein